MEGSRGGHGADIGRIGRGSRGGMRSPPLPAHDSRRRSYLVTCHFSDSLMRTMQNMKTKQKTIDAYGHLLEIM